MSSGPKTAAELSARVKISQPSVSRALTELSGEIGELVVFRNGRSIYYAIGQCVRSLPLRVPIYASGFRYGDLMAICGGGFLFTHINGSANYSESLPWFIQDMRPQGYIGRAFCHANAAALGLSSRLQDWTDSDVLFVLSQPLFDAPGNIEIGSPRKPVIPHQVDDVRLFYDRLANESVAGLQPGSSAGGEHAKFAVAIQEAGCPVRHVIVKFSPALDSPVAYRWKDLLVAEHLACEVLLEAGIAASESRLILSDERCYLESVRFDRSGDGVVSLGVADDEFVGERRSWAKSAARLRALGLMGGDADIGTIESFGKLIANTDMHFGNFSLYWRDGDKGLQFSPAPVYDMLPMMYAPEKGEIVSRTFTLPDIDDARAKQMAGEFWLKVSKNALVTPQFASIAELNSSIINSAR